MKYKRLTERRRETPLVMSMWPGDSESLKIYKRLAKLEDKIEAGELVDRDEYIDRLMAAKDISGMTDKELEFFAKHNAKVRENAKHDVEVCKQVVKECLQVLRDMSIACIYDEYSWGWDDGIDQAIQRLPKKYRIEEEEI